MKITLAKANPEKAALVAPVLFVCLKKVSQEFFRLKHCAQKKRASKVI